MAYATFTPAVRPSPGSTISREVSLRKASFGDGYTQSSPKGLNHIRASLSLKWDALTLAEAIALESFFVSKGGFTPFYYTIRGENEAKLWTCENWERSDGAPATFSATLLQSFVADI